VAAEGGLAVKVLAPGIPIAQGPNADLDRLGDEIAELSAHLEASDARLLDSRAR
jgi:hypothetical protein